MGIKQLIYSEQNLTIAFKKCWLLLSGPMGAWKWKLKPPSSEAAGTDPSGLQPDVKTL